MTWGHDTKFSPKMNYFFMFNMKIMKMNYFFMSNMKIILFCWLEIKYLLFLKQNTEHHEDKTFTKLVGCGLMSRKIGGKIVLDEIWR